MRGIYGIFGVLLILAVAGFFVFENPKITGELMDSAKMGEFKSLGNLTLKVSDPGFDFYEAYKMIDKKPDKIKTVYYKVYFKVFNNFSRASGVYKPEDNYNLEIWLEDNLMKKYAQDNDLISKAGVYGNKNVFGKNLEIYPRTIREGFLIFPEPKGEPEKLIIKTKEGAVEFEL